MVHERFLHGAAHSAAKLSRERQETLPIQTFHQDRDRLSDRIRDTGFRSPAARQAVRAYVPY